VPLTTVAFYESIDLGGSWGNLAAISDQHIYTEGDDLTVPELNHIVAVAAGVSIGGNQLARLSAPSLRRVSLPHINPNNGGADASAEPDANPAVMDLRRNPIILDIDEQLNAEAHSDTTAAAAQWVIVWLSDKPVTPVEGNIVTVRGTNTNTLTAGAWSNGDIALDEDIPKGRYQLVAMRTLSAGLVAARAVPRGGKWRPGCLGCDDAQDHTPPIFRYGQMGVWFEFEHNRIPSVDFLSISADSDQEVFLDLIKVA
jgi:hypothetical protein